MHKWHIYLIKNEHGFRYVSYNARNNWVELESTYVDKVAQLKYGKIEPTAKELLTAMAPYKTGESK